MLTDTQCRAARPREKAYKLTAQGMTKESMFAIGDYAVAPRGETLEQARARRDKDGATTFESVAREWLALKDREEITKARRLNMPQPVVFGKIGPLLVKQITPMHILDVLTAAARKNGPSVAAEAKRSMPACSNWPWQRCGWIAIRSIRCVAPCRPTKDPAQVLPAVDAFNARVRALLDTPLTMDAQGGLAPTILHFSHAAHAAWVETHDRIERELAGGGHYAAIRDGAAQAAENIARLAALLHVLDHGPAGAIDKACIESASRIVNWHLHEACRLLADLDAPPDLAVATRFDAWLRGEAASTGDPRTTSARIYQYGPGCVRDGNALRAALALLKERGRARVEQEGRLRSLHVGERGGLRGASTAGGQARAVAQ